MNKPDFFNPPLAVRPTPKICSHCSNTGIVVRELGFRRCICAAGQSPTTNGWHGLRVHPDDFVIR